MKQSNLKFVIVLLSAILSLSVNSQASSGFERSNLGLRDSIIEAADRSRQDQIRLRNQVSKATWQRMEALNQRVEAAIVIQSGSGADPAGPTAAGNRFNVEQVEQALVEPKKEESESNNFDYEIEDELRELSSL